MLNWFARLWEIDEEEYYGYITTCGTEGNLHGIYVGRENLPDGILYASQESHYSVFKAARMYRMPAVKVRRRAGACLTRLTWARGTWRGARGASRRLCLTRLTRAHLVHVRQRGAAQCQHAARCLPRQS